MSFGAIFLLAIGLAMDATAVSAARGMAVRAIRASHITRVAICFGGFQALMPAIGWMIGAGIGSIVEAWDHWLAFVLLAGIGGKMLWEANAGDGTAQLRRGRDVFGIRVMLILGVATSIDALAAGITLPMLDAPFLLSLATIGLTTAAMSAAGLFAGRRFGTMIGRRLEVVGGLALIGLGLKILVEHLSAG